MLQVAMLSRWHVHANDYVRELENRSDAQICAVWDEDGERGRAWAAELGVRFHENLEDLLSDDSIDAVVVDTPTTMHYDVIRSAIEAGKHVFTEKVLDSDYRKCAELLELARSHGVKLTVSLPRLTQSAYVSAERAVRHGMLGTVTQVRCRVAHDGIVPRSDRPNGWLPSDFLNPEKSAGGALIDLGAHPIYLANRFGGDVRLVSARLPGQDDPNRESMAVVVVEYESGVLGVVETSFQSAGGPFELQIYGTKGTLIANNDDVVVYQRLEELHRFERIELELNTNPGLAPMDQWIGWITEGRTPEIAEHDILNLTLVNQMALQSERTGMRISLADI